jgi:hypothetical protein
MTTDLTIAAFRSMVVIFEVSEMNSGTLPNGLTMTKTPTSACMNKV